MAPFSKHQNIVVLDTLTVEKSGALYHLYGQDFRTGKRIHLAQLGDGHGHGPGKRAFYAQPDYDPNAPQDRPMWEQTHHIAFESRALDQLR